MSVFVYDLRRATQYDYQGLPGIDPGSRRSGPAAIKDKVYTDAAVWNNDVPAYAYGIYGVWHPSRSCAAAPITDYEQRMLHITRRDDGVFGRQLHGYAASQHTAC